MIPLYIVNTEYSEIYILLNNSVEEEIVQARSFTT